MFSLSSSDTLQDSIHDKEIQAVEAEDLKERLGVDVDLRQDVVQ